MTLTLAFSEDPSLYHEPVAHRSPRLTTRRPLRDVAHRQAFVGIRGGQPQGRQVLVLLDVRAEEFSERFLDRPRLTNN